MIDLTTLIKRNEDSIASWQPSGITTVFDNGNKVYEKFFGYQDYEAVIPTSQQTTYCFSSLSYGLLGMSMLLLAQEGKISLEDSLSKYIPEYSHAKEIKLINLLKNNSGIPEYFYGVQTLKLQEDSAYTSLPFEQQFVHEQKILTRNLPFAQMLALINDMPLEYPCGSRQFAASDSNQNFLAEVISRVSGKSIFQFQKEYIFDRLNMKDTTEGYNTNSISYEYYQDVNRVAMEKIDCCYAITTTYDDIQKLAIGLYKKKLLSNKYWKMATQYNKSGYSICFEYEEGWNTFELYGIFGYRMSIMIKPVRNMYAIRVFSDMGKFLMEEQLWNSFVLDFITLLNEVTTFPLKAKVVPVSQKNVYDTVRLKVADNQQSFVWASPIALACTSAYKHNYRFVLEDCGVVIGLLILKVDKKENIFYVSTVLIDKRFQRRGYGKIMVAWGIEWLRNKGAKELTIGVNRHNVAARALYSSLGFAPANVFDEGIEMKLVF